MGTKDRYAFHIEATNVSGFVDLFKNGSSFGRFRLVDEVLSPGVVGDLSAIDCRFDWGAMDETVESSRR